MTLQLVPGPDVDASDSPMRAREPLPHLTSQTIETALRLAGGNVTQTAEKLSVARSSLYRRISAEPALIAARAEIVESLIDTAEGVIVAALARGDVNAATFVLRTQGHRRGWSTLAARQEAEQTPEPPRRRIDMTAALRALSPDELLQLEGLVSKLESSAKAEARALDADGGDDGSRRSFRRRRYLRGEVEASGEVEVELTAESDGAVSSRDETEPGEVSKPE